MRKILTKLLRFALAYVDFKMSLKEGVFEVAMYLAGVQVLKRTVHVVDTFGEVGYNEVYLRGEKNEEIPF